MRLSTNTIFAMGTQSILTQQARVAKVSQQLASGRRVVTPSDDPQAASQALTVAQALAANSQYAANRSTARRHLQAESNQLDNVTQALQAVKPLLVKAGDGTLNDSDRKAVATNLKGIYNEMLGYANARDGNGRYIFSGYKTDTKPFVSASDDSSGPSGDDKTLGDVTYEGDDNQRQLQVDGSRSMPINDPGSKVFGDKKNNILNTIAGVVSQLSQPLNSAANNIASAALTKTLDNANQQLDSSLDNVSTIQAAVGARLGELDTLDNTGANQKINYKTSLSDLQDVDMVSAISDYSLAKVALQAAEQTFSGIQKMSLFNLG